MWLLDWSEYYDADRIQIKLLWRSIFIWGQFVLILCHKRNGGGILFHFAVPERLTIFSILCYGTIMPAENILRSNLLAKSIWNILIGSFVGFPEVVSHGGFTPSIARTHLRCCAFQKKDLMLPTLLEKTSSTPCFLLVEFCLPSTSLPACDFTCLHSSCM